MNTALLTHNACGKHEMSPGHPESPQGLVAITDELKQRQLFDVPTCTFPSRCGHGLPLRTVALPSLTGRKRPSVFAKSREDVRPFQVRRGTPEALVATTRNALSLPTAPPARPRPRSPSASAATHRSADAEGERGRGRARPLSLRS